MLIGWENLNLIIAEKSIHKGKNDAFGVVINYLIDVGTGKVVFWTSSIQVPKIDTNPNSTLNFIHKEYVGHPFS